MHTLYLGHLLPYSTNVYHLTMIQNNKHSGVLGFELENMNRNKKVWIVTCLIVVHMAFIECTTILSVYCCIIYLFVCLFVVFFWITLAVYHNFENFQCTLSWYSAILKIHIIYSSVSHSCLIIKILFLKLIVKSTSEQKIILLIEHLFHSFTIPCIN